MYNQPDLRSRAVVKTRRRNRGLANARRYAKPTAAVTELSGTSSQTAAPLLASEGQQLGKANTSDHSRCSPDPQRKKQP